MLITSFMGPFRDEALSCFPSSDHIFPCRPHYTLCPVLKSRLAPKSCPWLSALATLHLTCPLAWLQVNPVLKTPGSSRLGVPSFTASAPWATPIPCVQCCTPLTPGSPPFSIAILKVSTQPSIQSSKQRAGSSPRAEQQTQGPASYITRVMNLFFI